MKSVIYQYFSLVWLSNQYPRMELAVSKSRDFREKRRGDGESSEKFVVEEPAHCFIALLLVCDLATCVLVSLYVRKLLL